MNNQTNDLEDWIFPDASIQNSNPAINGGSIDIIDLILNSRNTPVAPTVTKPILQGQTAASNTEAMGSNEPNPRKEDNSRGLEGYLQLMTGLKWPTHMQSLIQELIRYEAHQANIKKNRDEVIKNIAKEITGSENLVKFIEGKFVKGTKQILEANGTSSAKLLNPENQFRRQLVKEIEKRLD
ncbi:hypothetical protein INT45_001518 [Circinella minor]|uniref:Uncharacterized protein n=1 Tax=Circinella minor TaxID=1195481 RepID=A0A8H7VSD1_9FUNG|nr:hypothetical protein INT45_001518 [Circinella minor]